MKEYEINQIFTDDEDYSNKAQFCNENGYYIEEIEPKVETVDNEEVTTRQFQIKDTVDYYYIKELSSTKQLVEYTTNRRVAYDGDYLKATNTYKVSDVETSEKDGKLYLKGYAPKKTTEAFKEEKHAQLKAIMQSKRNNLTCEYNNDIFDCNEQAQSNMTSLMGFANLGMTDFPIRSTTEHTHVLTSEQLVELATLMSKAVNELYSEYWQYKNALYECETKEEVDNIRWE